MDKFILYLAVWDVPVSVFFFLDSHEVIISVLCMDRDKFSVNKYHATACSYPLLNCATFMCMNILRQTSCHLKKIADI